MLRGYEFQQEEMAVESPLFRFVRRWAKYGSECSGCKEPVAGSDERVYGLPEFLKLYDGAAQSEPILGTIGRVVGRVFELARRVAINHVVAGYAGKRWFPGRDPVAAVIADWWGVSHLEFGKQRKEWAC